MLDIGFSELILFSIVSIIFIGPERLPTVARTVGKYYLMLKNMILELQGIVNEDLKVNKFKQELNEEIKKLKSTETELRNYIKEIKNEISELTKQESKEKTNPSHLSVDQPTTKGEDNHE